MYVSLCDRSPQAKSEIAGKVDVEIDQMSAIALKKQYKLDLATDS